MLSQIITLLLVNRRLFIEGIGLLIAGIGFINFDITNAVAIDLKEFKPIKYIKGLIFAGLVFFGFGTTMLILDRDFIYGIVYMISGIALIIYVLAWVKDFRILTVIATLVVLGGFIGLFILSVLRENINSDNMGLIIFGIGLTIFQIGAQTDKDSALLCGGIVLFCGTALLGGALIVKGIVSIVGIALGSFIDSFIILNKDISKSISYILSGIGVIGIAIGYAFGGNSGRDKDRNIIGGVSYIITGIGFVGLSSLDIIYSGQSNQGVMTITVGIGLTLNIICGVSLIRLGKASLKNEMKDMMKNWGGVIFGFVGLSIQWIIEGQTFLGIGALMFLVTMILLLLSSENRKVMLVRASFFTVSSLLFCGALLYYGVNTITQCFK